ncbi:hypothetical protein [Bradyrhizobium uaiense]|uniref:hypothetical protein n=1 Tax=Bradyrhizobium uaiense TaxID=2594946 RepID=UPI0013D83F61|nr:hypothetical protein [Bradyrhizobium uaiense]
MSLVRRYPRSMVVHAALARNGNPGLLNWGLGSIEQELIVTDELHYRGHRLVVIEQQGDRSLVEITSLSGGQTIRTMTYQSRQEAIALAKQNIDKHPGG